jgi:diguanylate cyclase (GGDEF)-like protein
MADLEARPPQNVRAKRTYEYAVCVALVAWFVPEVLRMPDHFQDPLLLEWVFAILVVDLLPVPTSVGLPFSLSFPLQLSVALIYPPAVAGAVVFLGSTDSREFKGQIALSTALFNRAQIAWSVVIEGWIFHRLASLSSPWYVIGPAVLVAGLVGYAVNALLVAIHVRVANGTPVNAVLREMHVGVFGEFVASYMGLALFSVVVATTFVKIGPWSIAVFIAPLAFARQMFTRTHSLQEATDELAQRQAENEYQAQHDALTGLPNRALFLRTLYGSVDGMASGERLAVMIMDLDHFKEINDTLGHHFGDELLKEIGPRLSTALREGDVIARLGGDEFGVLLPDVGDDATAVHVAERLLAKLEEPLSVEGLALDVAGSIGIAVYPTHSPDVETILRRADVAMYAAKEAGSGFEIYSPTFDRHSPHRLTLASQVRKAIENHEFTLHYQPQVRLTDHTMKGVEALIRWEHPERGLVMPDDFIPLVERTVLLRPLTTYVLEEALKQWHLWARRGFEMTVAVNVSARSLLDVTLSTTVDDMLRRWDVPPHALTLELTESFLMAESGRSLGVLSALSEVGVRWSIDDFGTGYSSLSHLKRLPIGEIKIDRTFVKNMADDANDAMIVGATIDLGRNLGLQVIAEGVEDPATAETLRIMGCELAQGYTFSRPVPARDIARILEREQVASASSDDDPHASRLHVV